MVSTSEILFDDRLAMLSLSNIFKPNPKIVNIGIDKFSKIFVILVWKKILLLIFKRNWLLKRIIKLDHLFL